MIDNPLPRHWFMHTPHSVVGLGVAAKLRSGSDSLPDAPALLRPEARALRVGIIAGIEARWDWAATRLVEHLGSDPRMAVYFAWDCVNLGIDDSVEYDCLVLLGWPAACNRQRIKRIELYCRGGGALVALRAMHAEVPGWSSFAEDVLGGRQRLERQRRLLEVQRSETAWHHPVLEGVEPMLAEGQVYDGPRLPLDTTVLLTAQSEPCGQPVAWAGGMKADASSPARWGWTTTSASRPFFA